MPAEIPVASGNGCGQARRKCSASFSKAAAGSAPKRGDGHDAREPQPAEPANCSASAGTSAGSRAAAVCRRARVARQADLDETLQRRPAGAVLFDGHRLGQGRGQRLRRSTECTAWAYFTTDLAFLLWSWPMKCQLSPRSCSCAAFSAASWSRFSPTSVTPSDASRRTSWAGWNLVTTIRLRRRRPAGCGGGAADPSADGREPLPQLVPAAAQCARRRAAAYSGCFISSARVRPHQSGEAAGVGSRR